MNDVESVGCGFFITEHRLVSGDLVVEYRCKLIFKVLMRRMVISDESKRPDFYIKDMFQSFFRKNLEFILRKSFDRLRSDFKVL